MTTPIAPGSVQHYVDNMTNINPHKVMKITLAGTDDHLIYRQGSGNTIEIFNIHVSSERRKGQGRRLIYLLLRNYLPAGTKTVWAITRSSNLIAQQFYENLRFRVVAVLRDFYKDEHEGTADAIMFGRDVGSEA